MENHDVLLFLNDILPEGRGGGGGGGGCCQQYNRNKYLRKEMLACLQAKVKIYIDKVQLLVLLQQKKRYTPFLAAPSSPVFTYPSQQQTIWWHTQHTPQSFFHVGATDSIVSSFLLFLKFLFSFCY